MTGKEPPENIDHVNGNSLDNRWSNLRAATVAQNQQNKSLQRNNHSGLKGVHWDAGRPGKKNWKAVITADGVVHQLGRFYSKHDAANAVNAKRAVLHGEFARLA